jgi:hypothetical protein
LLCGFKADSQKDQTAKVAKDRKGKMIPKINSSLSVTSVSSVANRLFVRRVVVVAFSQRYAFASSACCCFTAA